MKALAAKKFSSFKTLMQNVMEKDWKSHLSREEKEPGLKCMKLWRKKQQEIDNPRGH